MPLKVLIIGGGLSGALLTNGLLKHSIDVTVYECDAAYSSRKGYQIRLGALALHGFHECLSLEVKDAICSKFGRSGGTVASAPVMYSQDMKVLVDLKLSSYLTSAPISRVVLRDALAKGVVKAGRIVYRKMFVRYEVFTPDGGDAKTQKVRAHFADGTTDECDVLIAADRSNSKINTQVGLNNIITLHKIHTFFANGPISQATLHSLPAEIKHAPVAIIHEDKILFSSCYLPDKVSPNPASSSPSKPKYDEEEASIMLGFDCAATCLPKNFESFTNTQIKASIRDLVKDWSPKITAIVDAIPRDSILLPPQDVLSPR